MEHKISVIVPVCGRLNRLKQTVESILLQNHDDFEVIVVETIAITQK